MDGSLGLDGDAALVTGSSSGLGKATARVLAAAGADVAVNGRDEERLERAAAELRRDGSGRVAACPGDLTDPEDVDAVVERATDALGGLDHLVKSAGGPPEGLLYDIPDEEWYEGFDLLVMSFLHLLQAATPHLRDGGGTVVNIASISVKETFGSLGLGSAVRMPTVGIAKVMARELGPEVRVNTVLPGLYETPRFREHVESKVDEGVFDSYEAGLASYAEASPLERVGDPVDMGRTVAFLCSEWARHVTGAAIPVDGGVTNSNL